jgi:hypothetical protein
MKKVTYAFLVMSVTMLAGNTLSAHVVRPPSNGNYTAALQAADDPSEPPSAPGDPDGPGGPDGGPDGQGEGGPGPH